MTSVHTKLRLLLGILCAAAVCSGQDTKDAQAAGPYKVGGGVSPPRLISKVEPKFSEEARISHFAGTVLLGATLGTDGRASSFKVLRHLGLGLDENAIAAVSNWQFKPGEKEGQPVNVFAQIEVNFRMVGKDTKSRWQLRRVEFHIPEGAMRPIIEKVTAPKVANDEATPNVRLTFDIDEKGVAVNIPIETASKEGWSGDVAAALRKWKFIPASMDGVPISVSCTMEFARGN